MGMTTNGNEADVLAEIMRALEKDARKDITDKCNEVREYIWDQYFWIVNIMRAFPRQPQLDIGFFEQQLRFYSVSLEFAGVAEGVRQLENYERAVVAAHKDTLQVRTAYKHFFGLIESTKELVDEKMLEANNTFARIKLQQQDWKTKEWKLQ